jgi:hypothetical protein
MQLAFTKGVATKTPLYVTGCLRGPFAAWARFVCHKSIHINLLWLIPVQGSTGEASAPVGFSSHQLSRTLNSRFARRPEAVTRRLGDEPQSRRVFGLQGGNLLGKSAYRRRHVVALVGAEERQRSAVECTGIVRKGRENERRRELSLSASRVNCWGGRSASDRQAPQKSLLRGSSRLLSTRDRPLVIITWSPPVQMRSTARAPLGTPSGSGESPLYGPSPPAATATRVTRPS